MLQRSAEHEMTTGGLVVGCGWICMDLYLLPWKPVLWESHGSQAKLKEVQTPFFLNLESLNVADLLRSTARDERKDHKHRCRCKERRQFYAWIPPGLPSFWLFLTHLPPFLKLHSCQDCKGSILCNTCNTSNAIRLGRTMSYPRTVYFVCFVYFGCLWSQQSYSYSVSLGSPSREHSRCWQKFRSRWVHLMLKWKKLERTQKECSRFLSL